MIIKFIDQTLLVRPIEIQENTIYLTISFSNLIKELFKIKRFNQLFFYKGKKLTSFNSNDLDPDEPVHIVDISNFKHKTLYFQFELSEETIRCKTKILEKERITIKDAFHQLIKAYNIPILFDKDFEFDEGKISDIFSVPISRLSQERIEIKARYLKNTQELILYYNDDLSTIYRYYVSLDTKVSDLILKIELYFGLDLYETCLLNGSNEEISDAKSLEQWVCIDRIIKVKARETLENKAILTVSYTCNKQGCRNQRYLYRGLGICDLKQLFYDIECCPICNDRSPRVDFCFYNANVVIVLANKNGEIENKSYEGDFTITADEIDLAQRTSVTCISV